jgi:exopolyphosphatase/guanosine-5'-triphosphate,3'-diphosphate pyrophosphatase
VPRRAAIDVGTNSVRLLVAEVGREPATAAAVRPVLRSMAITRLGEGLQAGGAIRPAAAARTAAAVEEYVARAAAAGAPEPVIVGTYALRAARNPGDLLDRLSRPVRVLSGRDEARLGFRGALAGLGLRGPAARALVVDIGGGSVELTWGAPQGIDGTQSLPLGCVVLTRTFLAHDPPLEAEVSALRARLGQRLDPVLEPLRRRRLRLVGVGGTITTMAALVQRLDPYDPERVHGYRLSASRVREITADLLGRPLGERRRLAGLQPERADIIGAGALVLQHLLERLGRRSIVVSEADLLWALVLGL